MNSYLLIGIGSALGGIARHWCSSFLDKILLTMIPWGTILVNVLGCFLIGCLAYFAQLDQKILSNDLRALLMIGFCGGYTTFSAFSLESFQLLKNGEWLNMFGNIIFSVIFCLVAIFIGYFFASLIKST
ncbi:MAG: hypothetical protein CBC38_04630 [Gammaproteobacteria bacterium TMED78]|nr:MAG: hypothetical protein CBC38_04630 [Gammaproteobacteria bacterium TMED78]